MASVEHRPLGLLVLLGVASLTSIGPFVATAQAAPIMLRVKDVPDDEILVAPLLDRFARWHARRAALQVLTFFVLLWALLVAR